MGRKNLARWQREDQLMNLFRAVGEGEVTVHDVARIIDVAPSAHLRGLLHDLVDKGVLTFREVPHRNNAVKRLYKPLPVLTQSDK